MNYQLNWIMKVLSVFIYVNSVIVDHRLKIRATLLSRTFNLKINHRSKTIFKQTETIIRI